MTPYYLLLLVFNLNGQYQTTVMNYEDRTSCMEARDVWVSLKPLKHAKYHHSLCLCLRGESSEDLDTALKYILAHPEELK
jgi:hypothetical protein